MELLQVKGLTFAVPDKQLYEDSSFTLRSNEHMGIVGKNGAGKSTLLKMLLGTVLPDDGVIIWNPTATLGYLDQYVDMDQSQTINEFLTSAYQELFETEKEMIKLYERYGETGDDQLLSRAATYQEQLEIKGFYQVENDISKAITGLGINDAEQTLETLNRGDQIKVILAKLLLEKPSVLILDEPTNYLDQEHIEWLTDYLNAFENAFIIVSHDTEFLSNIATCICDIDFGTIKKYHSNHTEFLKQKAHLAEAYQSQFEAQQRKIKETEAFIQKNIAGIKTKMAQGRRKHLEKMDRLKEPEKKVKSNFSFKLMPQSSPNVLTIEELTVGHKERLLTLRDFQLKKGEKIVITGADGLGKSMLVKTLLSMVPAISGKSQFSPQVAVGYHSQEIQWENTEWTPIEALANKYTKLTYEDVRRELAKCGLKREIASKNLYMLSGGEQSKVKLCDLTMQPSNLLILDEPTNHLDVESKKALQDALKAFRGSVLLISNDEQFYTSIADHVYTIADKQMMKE
ncbi:ABC transporter ATP-binding protein [Enterococcus ureilyticus]|uniref:ABC transporter ATP-binding protein n=1 Tax=Enterococcus ureilyticus TaxID=1131292 RepID=A0A1E5H5R6_9ENTE|nr:ABC-F family ATP-binding cassette domain-containing protein [Enterococcus ureilyticus]MBM7689016.1 ATPase subunit of ABC transporter with duplicated ATPase domains [Enterococcus ureilyticus]OEG20186.1 ABC transporter ATP-binding protein [Enterococcus ureilyticus]